jgi:hypothetical protein
MRKLLSSLGAVQNIGWLDRTVRFFVGFALIVFVLRDMQLGIALGWHAYLPIIAIYPLMTGILGWDPFYATAHVKTCDTSSHNKCGTYLFEVESGMGKDVSCDDGYDCSLPGNEKSHQH